MKYLKDYTDQAITELFEKHGAFFAFSDKQLDEAKNKDLPRSAYVSMGAGLIAPKSEAKELASWIDKVTTKRIALDLEENGKEAIILRELHNHECFYTGDYLDPNMKASLSGYGFTDQDIYDVYRSEYQNAMKSA